MMAREKVHITRVKSNRIVFKWLPSFCTNDLVEGYVRILQYIYLMSIVMHQKFSVYSMLCGWFVSIEYLVSRFIFIPV
jgi:hypothetical protein